jgi:hypothetical protein
MPNPRRGGGLRLPEVGGFNVSELRLPDIDLQSLLDNWSEYAFGADYEAGTDPYGNPNIRHERGMFDIARDIAAEEQGRKREAFSLFKEKSLTDLKAAQQAMELQRIADQRARQRELQARRDAQRDRTMALQEKRQREMDLFGNVQAPGSMVPTGTRPGWNRFGGSGIGGGMTISDVYGALY